MSDKHSIRIRQIEAYAFRIDFGESFVPLLTDEPEPIGGGTGPSPEQVLIAAVSNCLCASLAFALGKYRQEGGGVSAEAIGRVARNAEGRLRLVLDDPEAAAMPVHVVSPEGRRAPPKVRALIDLAGGRPPAAPPPPPMAAFARLYPNMGRQARPLPEIPDREPSPLHGCSAGRRAAIGGVNACREKRTGSGAEWSRVTRGIGLPPFIMTTRRRP